MGMTFQSAEDSKWKRIHAEVNRMYMENREEMETTTVCDSTGNVTYVHGKPPEKRVSVDPPEWKVNKMEANIRAMERAYPIK